MGQVTLSHGVWTFDESKRLGEAGAFGFVYSGVGANGEAVAVKVFHPGVGRHSERELQIVGALAGRRTRYIIPVLDAGVDAFSGTAAIVMRRAEHSLRVEIASKRPIVEPEVANILSEIANGLLEADDIVHRDLKPENVLLFESRWNVADFGIARIVEAQTASGTMKEWRSPPYAAPEQWEGRRATHATDIYALGCIAIELLTGEPPFRASSIDEYAEKHRHEAPTIAHGSAKLRALLHRMLAKPEAARPDIEETIRQLARIATPQAKPGMGALKLEEVASVVARERAQFEADAAVVEAERQRRRALSEHANIELRSIADQLFESIKELAGESAEVSQGFDGGCYRYRAELGQGWLTMSVGSARLIDRRDFSPPGWDVIAGDLIMVGSTSYKRSASLWYADMGSGIYSWREVAYFAIRSDQADQPCFLKMGRDAAEALGLGLRPWRVAHQPRTIDLDGVDRFCERWMNFFADAAAGRLRAPNNLPEPD